jgi:hypothetical protein
MARRPNTTKPLIHTAPAPATQQNAEGSRRGGLLFGDPINFAIMVGTIVAATVAVGTLAYTIGKDVGAAELKTRQDLALMDIPKINAENRETTRLLQEATTAFNDMLVNNATYAEMDAAFGAVTAEAVDLRNKNEALVRQNAALSKQLGDANLRIETLTSVKEERELIEGTAVALYGGAVTVGLVKVWPSGSADVKVNGRAHSVTTGDILGFNTGAGSPCAMTATLGVQSRHLMEWVDDESIRL